ncbi:MAG: glycosyltransferase family 2 protein [Actinobacteria bacterium]|nr:MAG: glycosyltransferase family 2 protein [Actinomycetota bacterium]
MRHTLCTDDRTRPASQSTDSAGPGCKPSGMLVSVTVVMPIRNEVAFIRRSLGALLDQDYPMDLMEIVIADGKSQDGTREVVREYMARHPNLRLIDNPGRIVPTGLNRAIRQAKGDVIVRVDGHTVVARDYVSQCVALLRRSGADNVGGAMRPEGQGRFGRAVAAATNSPFGVGDARFHYSEEEEWVDTVYMGAWPRALFDQIGLFDEEMVRDQDDELNYRLLERGGRILLSPKIRSSYTARGTPRSLWRQYFQYGYWKVRVVQKHPRQVRLRQLAPPVFTAALCGSLFVACVAPQAVLAWGAVPLTYAVACITASITTARRAGWSILLLLPPTFAILHVSYGLGFLFGLARFAARWGSSRASQPSPTTDEGPTA